jgi:2-methylcitrate dehydratase
VQQSYQRPVKQAVELEMDTILELVSSYGAALVYQDLSAPVIHQLKRRVIDTFGCALGCIDMELPSLARAHALEVGSKPGSTVLGTRHTTSPEAAAFANGVAVRYLDFNDTSIAGNAGHPSDNMMAVFAAGQYAGADIKSIMLGIVLAYEVHGRFGAACRKIRANGWDNAVYVGLASAAGAAKAMGLDKPRIAHALALAAVANAPMGQTRVGHLSTWKGCTAPNAARNGVFAALLARRGMTGPEEAFEGSRGFKKQLGTTLDLAAFGSDGFMIEADKFKSYPCDYEAQCALEPALKLHEVLQGGVNEIESIDIETYEHAILISADGPAKWSPKTRETADHSLPYVVAVGLARGSLWLEDFEDDRIADPAIHQLMQKINVRSSDEYNRSWPEAYPFRVSISMKSGEQYVEEVRYAKGHPKNPLSDSEIEAKFRRLAEPVMAQDRIDHTLERLWQLEEMKTAQELMELFALDKLGNQ